MISFQILNTSILTLCAVICFILLLCMLTADYRKDELSRIFIAIVCCQIPLLFVDTIAYNLNGSSNSYTYIVMWSMAFLSFFLGTVLGALFSRYLLIFLRTKKTVSRKTVSLSYTAIAFCGVNIVLITLSLFNGMYFYIDETNTLQYGQAHLLSQVIAFLIITLNIGIVIIHIKVFTIRERVYLLSYAVLPLAAIVIMNLWVPVSTYLNAATTMTILIFYVGIENEIYNRLKQNELDIRISVMLSQIQPHFIYNSLTAIQRLCQKDPALAEEAVVDFTRYLRGNIDALSLKITIPFLKELEHTKSYLAIEKKRFGEKINVEYELNADEFNLPALTLQPIVENAVRYGITKREKGGTVTISTRETEADFQITVTDDGAGFDINKVNGDAQTHVGIENVRSRIAAMCGGTLTIKSRPGIGTTVVISIPKAEQNLTSSPSRKNG